MRVSPFAVWLKEFGGGEGGGRGNSGKSPTHIRSLPFLPQPRDLFEVLEHHGRQDVAGADAVDPDTSGAVFSDGAPFHGEIAGQLNDGGL